MSRVCGSSAILSRNAQTRERDADLFQIFVSKVGQRFQIDLVIGKRFRVSTEPKRFEPFVDVARPLCLWKQQCTTSLRRLSGAGHGYGSCCLMSVQVDPSPVSGTTKSGRCWMDSGRSMDPAEAAEKRRFC
jgi:hypothetical protein